MNVRGQYLTVEFAKKSISADSTEHDDRDDVGKEESKRESANKSNFQAFLQKLNSWTMNQVFNQPPPPHIRYKYAPPTRSTLIRIAVQLLKEPAFYTQVYQLQFIAMNLLLIDVSLQVLHLMNRMNLPPPFEELETEFPMLKEAYNMEKYKDILGKSSLRGKGMEGSELVASFCLPSLNISVFNLLYATDSYEERSEEEESEIESNEDDSTRPLEIIPVKRKRPQSTKRLKIPKFVNPAKQIVPSSSTQKVVKPEDMFESIQRTETKNLKIELKTVDKLLDASNREDVAATESATDGGFGLIFPPSKDLKADENDEGAMRTQQEVITSKELAENKISANGKNLFSLREQNARKIGDFLDFF